MASTSENCLYLNVYTPPGAHTATRNLPVMVWIHGGSLLVGESDDYNPAGLVRHGVIVDTINYRLGALGFLADSTLARHPGGSSGNYGLMDQQAALRWVQANIARFGGNPRNVTLSGESAGGLSVLAQLTSPGARGLFSRAIVESGTYDLIQAPLATAEAAGQTFAAKAGCAYTVNLILGAYREPFAAVAESAATLAGLLFVAMSVTPGHGPTAAPAIIQQVRAPAALLAFINAFAVSIFGLVPGNNVGYPAVALGVVGDRRTGIVASIAVLTGHPPGPPQATGVPADETPSPAEGSPS